jgi:hypothetical protein
LFVGWEHGEKHEFGFAISGSKAMSRLMGGSGTVLPIIRMAIIVILEGVF